MTSCRNCTYENGDNDPICIVCSYPTAGTDQEKARFISKQVMAKNDVVHAIQKVRHTRNALFVLSGLFLILTSYLALFYGFRVLLKSVTILTVLFFLSALISVKRPVAGMSIALGVTLGIYGLQLIFYPMAFAAGALWKCIIITIILYGFSAVLSANKTLRTNPYIADMLGYKSLGRIAKKDVRSDILDQSR